MSSKLTGLFISKGPVVIKRTFDGKIEEDWDRNAKVAWDGPLVVLVSRASASASEIVAGALQSHGRAIVVGDESTHGKGTVQAPIDLRNAMQTMPFGTPLQVGTVKVTVQQFYLPNGESTQNRGVLADIALPSANMFLLTGEADLDNALSWGRIDPIEFQLPERENPEFAIVRNDLLETLQTRTSLRMADYEEFDYLNRTVAWYEERHEQKSVVLNLEQRRAEKESLESMRLFFDELRDGLNRELAYSARAVKLDLTESKERAHQEKLRATPLPNGQPRANQFYQKVFYYEDADQDKIHEIWIEFFDYDKALARTDDFAGLFSDQLGREISTTQTTAILTRFKNADRGSDFNALDPFREVLGDDMDEAAVSAALPAFFGLMVEADPDVLLERPKLDVPLRESLRIVRDWADLQSPLNRTKIAVKVAAKEEEPLKEAM